MNAFDLVALVSLAVAAKNGYRQGLAKEIYRLARLAVALLVGSGLAKLASGWLAQAAGMASGWTAPLAFVVVSAAIWTLLRGLQKWLLAWLLGHTPRKFQSAGGALVATAKAAVLIPGVITVFRLAVWLPGHDLVARDSLAAQIARPFLGSFAGE